MDLEDKYREFMANMLRDQAEKLAVRPVKIEMKTAEVIATLAVVEIYVNDPANRSSTSEFIELLRNAHMRLSVSLNVQQ